MIAIKRTLPRIRSLLFVIRALFAEVCHPNLQSFVWRHHVCALLRGTNMATVTYQKHLLLSFAFEMKNFTLELWNIEINASSTAWTVWLAKIKVIAHLLWQPFLAAISSHATKKLGNLNMLFNKTKNPNELKHCQTSIFYWIFYLM